MTLERIKKGHLVRGKHFRCALFFMIALFNSCLYTSLNDRNRFLKKKKTKMPYTFDGIRSGFSRGPKGFHFYIAESIFFLPQTNKTCPAGEGRHGNTSVKKRRENTVCGKKSSGLTFWTFFMPDYYFV